MASQAQIPISQTMLTEGRETAYWEQFQEEIEARVRETNLVSETLLWQITRVGEPADRVTVACSFSPDDLIDCSFDAARERITCLPGPAVSAPLRVFDWTGTRLCCEGVDLSVAAAVSIVLDELVCDGGPGE